jgi:predicted dehydrogenase
VNPVKVVVVGAGHLGTYHAEKIYNLPTSQLVAICDPNLERAQQLAKKLDCQAVESYDSIMSDVDAAIIAAPTPLHFKIASDFLKQQKHILVEKPVTETADQAKELCALAKESGLVLQVGHVERFNPALLAAKKQLKNPLFIECHRLAPFKPRSTDVDVVLDLMIHDIDVIMSLVDSPVVSVTAVGSPVITSYVDIANARIEFESQAVANITASRVSQTATRKFRVFQETQYLSIDFGSGEVNLTTKVGDNWDDLDNELPLEFESWELEKGDALMAQDQSFIQAIIENKDPVVSGEQAVRAMIVAEQIRDEIGRRLAKR